jgi:hypothetical protein
MSFKESLTSLGLLLVLATATAAPVSAKGCSRKMGPFYTFDEAEVAAQHAVDAGYETSGVYGNRTVYSDTLNRRYRKYRRYFFNVFFQC